jgi:hypothetical protein
MGQPRGQEFRQITEYVHPCGRLQKRTVLLLLLSLTREDVSLGGFGHAGTGGRCAARLQRARNRHPVAQPSARSRKRGVSSSDVKRSQEGDGARYASPDTITPFG